jgi:hypothetical protein
MKKISILLSIALLYGAATTAYAAGVVDSAMTRSGGGRQCKYQPTTGAAKAVKAACDESVSDRMTACDERQQ